VVFWYTAGAVLGAFAYQHMAYIVQYGSIFNSPRAWLACRVDSWLCCKLHELVTCQLCTITQLALWLWALPVLWIGYGQGIRLTYLVVAAPVVWFSEAAFGLAAWDLMRLIGRGSDALIWALRKESERWKR
jgi:hypothetical protein